MNWILSLKGFFIMKGWMFMLVIETEFANFGNPQDLLLYMLDEQIETVYVTAKYCLCTFVKNLELTIQDVRNWVSGNIPV